MTTLQRALANEMSRLSEECYCAGWMTGLEYQLWEVVLGSRTEYGLHQFTSEEITGLRELSALCGGWIVWSDEEQEEVFIPIEKWEAIFAKG